jgi:hypothetical protein
MSCSLLFSLMRAPRPFQLSFLDFVTFGKEQYYEAPRSAPFAASPHPSLLDGILPSALCFQTPSTYVLPKGRETKSSSVIARTFRRNACVCPSVAFYNSNGNFGPIDRIYSCAKMRREVIDKTHLCTTMTSDYISSAMTYVMWSKNTFRVTLYSKE